MSRPLGILAGLSAAVAASVAGPATPPATPAAVPAPPTFAVTARWTLGGEGGWDYLTFDTDHRRLFITRGDRVEVIDPASGARLGTIAGASGAHGVALAPALGRGWISNGRRHSVTEFDYATLATRREVPIPGQNPDAIVYDEASGRLVTFNGGSHDATLLDARTLAVVATVPLPDKPEFAQVDGRGRVFVNIESEPGRLVTLDLTRAAVIADVPLPGCDAPTGLAFDAAHRRLFSTCDGRTLAVTDADSGRAVARVPIGAGPDAVVYDATRQLVLSSNGEGTLTVVRQLDADRYAPAQTLATQRGARTMALDPSTGRLYLVSAEFAAAAAPAARPAPVPGTFTVLVVDPR